MVLTYSEDGSEEKSGLTEASQADVRKAIEDLESTEDDAEEILLGS